MRGETVPDNDRSVGQRRTAVVAWLLAALYVVILAVTLWMDARIYAEHAPQAGTLTWLGLHGPWMGPFVVFAVVGATIVSRRPRNLIGWLLLTSALLAVVGEAVRTRAKLVLDGPDDSVLVALTHQPFMVVTVLGLFLGVVVVPLVFPDGRLPSHRWRWVLWAIGAALGMMIFRGTFSERLIDEIFLPGGQPVVLYDLANPLAVGLPARIAAALPEVSLLLALLAMAAPVAVAVRFRRSRDVERLQLKWFVFAAALVVVAAAGLVALSAIGQRFAMDAAALGLLVAGLSAYPVAIGVAVLRYRLYAIDRLISRTVAYGLIVTVLGGVYVVGVVGLGEVVAGLTGQRDSDLVVAVSVLAVVGAFGPVRSRVRTAVDRRFNRTGYQARRAVENFTSDVRDEVDLDVIRARTAETVAAAVQPTHVSIWLADSTAWSPRPTKHPGRKEG